MAKRLFISFICLVLAGQWPAAQNNRNSQHIGFRLPQGVRSVTLPIKVKHNLIIIPVRVNGSVELDFVLDTGVKTTLLTEPLVLPMLGIDAKRLRPVKVRGLGKDEVVDANLATNLRFEIAGMVGAGVSLIVLPPDVASFSEMVGQPVFGIIGYDLLKHFVVEIDYVRQYVRFIRPDVFEKQKRWGKKRRSSKWVELPLEMRKSKPYVEASLSVNGKPAAPTRLLVDTGASNALSLFDKEHGLPEKNFHTYLGRGLNGDIYGRLGRVDGLGLGQFGLGGVVAAYPDSASLKVGLQDGLWQGNLGGGVLRRFHIFLSYPHRKLLLKPNAHLKKPYDYNRSGVEVLATGVNFNEFVVSYVRPGSPAQAAGLQPGDRIVAINGDKAVNLDIGELYERLNKVTGKPLHLRLERNGERLGVRFVVREEL